MRQYQYLVKFSNGRARVVSAFGFAEATILAQAEQINAGEPWDRPSIEMLEEQMA